MRSLEGLVQDGLNLNLSWVYAAFLTSFLMCSCSSAAELTAVMVLLCTVCEFCMICSCSVQSVSYQVCGVLVIFYKRAGGVYVCMSRCAVSLFSF